MISIRLDHHEQEATMTGIAMTREIGSHGMAASVAARLGLSTYRLLAAYQTLARLNAGLAEATGRFSECRWLISTNDLRDSERRYSASRHLPGSVFDARYTGLTAHAARLDAAICRHERLR
jgi:hypothetical protein